MNGDEIYGEEYDDEEEEEEEEFLPIAPVVPVTPTIETDADFMSTPEEKDTITQNVIQGVLIGVGVSLILNFVLRK